jgi:hypothetical protein
MAAPPSPRRVRASSFARTVSSRDCTLVLALALLAQPAFQRMRLDLVPQVEPCLFQQRLQLLHLLSLSQLRSTNRTGLAHIAGQVQGSGRDQSKHRAKSRLINANPAKLTLALFARCCRCCCSSSSTASRPSAASPRAADVASCCSRCLT